MRPPRFVSLAVALILLVPAAVSAQSVPDGWVEEDEPRPGSIQTLRHIESQSGVDVVRVLIGEEDLGRFSRNLGQKLTGEGFTAAGAPKPTTIGGAKGTVTRYTRTVLDKDFTVLVYDFHQKGSLLQIVAWFRPTEESSASVLQKDVLKVVGSLVK